MKTPMVKELRFMIMVVYDNFGPISSLKNFGNMASNNGLIFVQIASCRDRELLPTVQNMIENCSNPDKLRFGICWQHDPADEWDKFGELYCNDNRFRIVDVPHKDSKGCCWARNLLPQQ